MPTPAVIKSILDFPDTYYCGPHKGWLPDIGQAVHYASLSAAQLVIQQHNMYAIAVVFPIVSSIVSNFVGFTHREVSICTRLSTASFDGLQVDLSTGGETGPYAALQCAVGAGGGSTLDGKIQGSDDGMSWADIPGATFDTVGPVLDLQMIEFTTLKAFVRYHGEIGGGAPLYDLSVVIFRATQ